MSYSENSKALAKVKKFLNPMAKEVKRHQWRVEDAAKTAYEIRQGMAVAEKLRDPTFASLRLKYVIRARGGLVIADPRSYTAAEDQLSEVNLPDVTDVLEIIGAAIHHKAEKLFFPAAILNEDDLNHLYNWAQANEYHIIPSQGGLTLTKENVGDIAWTPKSS